MFGLRLGDEVDDYCIKCKRTTNHFILAMIGQSVAKVRCRTCYNEQEFRNCEPLPPRPRSVKKVVDAPPAVVDAESAPELLPELPAEPPAPMPAEPKKP